MELPLVNCQVSQSTQQHHLPSGVTFIVNASTRAFALRVAFIGQLTILGVGCSSTTITSGGHDFESGGSSNTSAGNGGQSTTAGNGFGGTNVGGGTSVGTSSGGIHAAAGGTSTLAGGATAVGGTNTGGIAFGGAGQGGAATGGANIGTATGGRASGGAATGGTNIGVTTGGTAMGGAATGGTKATSITTGGTNIGVSTGGAATGGTNIGVTTGGTNIGVTTGGAATGGMKATGGAATGGAATGGRATGGAATGGRATGGASPVPCDCSIASVCYKTGDKAPTNICQICNPALSTINWSNNPVSCDDGNACTTGEVCNSGQCSGGTTKTCSASDQCHTGGTCDPATGLCSNPAKPNNTQCTHSNLCITNESCQNGVCTGPEINCGDPGPCMYQPACVPTTGVCPPPEIVNEGQTCCINGLCGSCLNGNCDW